jgi:hypothetical protein
MKKKQGPAIAPGPSLLTSTGTSKGVEILDTLQQLTSFKLHTCGKQGTLDGNQFVI